MQQNLFKPFERIFDEAEDEFSHACMKLGGEVSTAPIDIAEWDGEFAVICNLPGFTEDDIDLRVTDHTLHIHAEHEGETGIEDDDYIHRERKHADVSRTVSLPGNIDEDDVSATFENGVLMVTLPKLESEDGHRISIS